MAAGRELFNHEWTSHDPLTSGDGLGPVFNARSCVECHHQGGSGGGGGVNQQVPFRNPAPAFSRNIIVTRAVGNYPYNTEPHIAVDPTDPEHLVLGTIDFNLNNIAAYVSFDGGETWDGPNQVRYFREDFTAAGDPVLAFDRDGTVYMTSISLGFEEFRIGTVISASEVSSMVVSKSTDGGLTWSAPATTANRATGLGGQPVVQPTGRWWCPSTTPTRPRCAPSGPPTAGPPGQRRSPSPASPPTAWPEACARDR
jgi:hypothetical protein